MNINQSMFIQPVMRTVDSAWLGHAPFAAWLIEEFKPRSFVELGTHTGFSYLAICQAIKQLGHEAQCCAVDTWQGDEHAGHYGDEIFEKLRTQHDEPYGSFSSLLRMTFDQALEQFGPGSVDLLHIDGLHTYEAVKHDYESWLPKMSRNGVILFHDTHIRDEGFGVWKLWDELAQAYPSITFTHSAGLGCLFVGGDIDPDKLKFLESEKEVELTKALFSALGEGVKNRWEKDFVFSEHSKLSADKQAIDNAFWALEERCAAIENECERTKKELDLSNNECERTKKERDLSNNEKTRVIGELQQLKNELNSVYQSTSWKITEPIRWLKGVLE